MRSGSTETSIATSNGACMRVNVVMISRQMCSTVASGKPPSCRSTSLRIMSASRAGRNAAPGRAVPFVLISASMTVPRVINRRCISASIASILVRSWLSVRWLASP